MSLIALQCTVLPSPPALLPLAWEQNYALRHCPAINGFARPYVLSAPQLLQVGAGVCMPQSNDQAVTSRSLLPLPHSLLPLLLRHPRFGEGSHLVEHLAGCLADRHRQHRASAFAEAHI